MSAASWSEVQLDSLLRPLNRKELVDPTAQYTLLGARWYAKGLYTKEVKLGNNIKASHLYRVRTGDFVYNRLFAWKGSFAVASTENDGCYVSNEFPCFEVDRTQILPEFLWLFFQREATWNSALGLSFGATPTSRNRLKETNLLSMAIPLPPLGEQRKVVSRIEFFSTKMAEVSQLRSESRERRSTLFASVTSEICDTLDDVPHVAIGELGQGGCNPVQTGPFGAQLHSSEFTEDGVPVLNVGNVWPEGLRLDYVDHVSPEKAIQLSRYAIKTDDLLFARSGATLGKVCIVPQTCDGWLMTGHLFRVRFDQNRCLPAFAFAVLRGSRKARDQIFGQVRGATRPGFNTTLLSRVEIPLPPLEQQRRIIARLEQLSASLDKVRSLHKRTSAEFDALLPSILDRAFRGEM